MYYYLSLGSNLGDKKSNINQALDIIRKRIGEIICQSAFYYTEPWGFKSDNGFVNICVEVESVISPFEMLDATASIEREIGRKTKSNGCYSDRIIDIDIVLADNMIIDTERLKIPHPLMAERMFVLEPLNEIAPDIIHPKYGKRVSDLFEELKGRI